MSIKGMAKGDARPANGRQITDTPEFRKEAETLEKDLRAGAFISGDEEP